MTEDTEPSMIGMILMIGLLEILKQCFRASSVQIINIKLN
jgi:hypothetical protein